jgi:hypothetical protein
MLPYLTDQLVEEQTHAKSNQEEIIQTKSELSPLDRLGMWRQILHVLQPKIFVLHNLDIEHKLFSCPTEQNNSFDIQSCLLYIKYYAFCFVPNGISTLKI